MGSFSRRARQGRKRCTDPRNDRFIRQTALECRKITSTGESNLRTANYHPVSSRTIRSGLNETGLATQDRQIDNYIPDSTKLQNCVLSEIITNRLLMNGSRFYKGES